jgi:hypothetical protein
MPPPGGLIYLFTVLKIVLFILFFKFWVALRGNTATWWVHLFLIFLILGSA